MSHENWLITGLTLTVTVILALIVALTYSYQWSLLAIATLVFTLLYPMIWIAWQCYQFWSQTIKHLTTYTQILREGEHNLRLKQQHKKNLLLGLQIEIETLAKANIESSLQSQTVDNLVSRILDSWSIPVCLFDENLRLSYRNLAMNEQLQQPMLVGALYSDLGFELTNDNFIHGQFDNRWQCQSISYLHNDKKCWLFSAFDISQPLHQHQSLTQQNLIRVLAHELRNSLTPMSSMADTLLTSSQLDEQQTRLVLSRIRQRSDRLLSFIGQYSQLTQLPKPKATWFDIKELLAEAKSMTKGSLDVQFQGNDKCYGDIEQVSQILINVFKNAQEACQQDLCIMTVKTFSTQQNQVIEIYDNGPGFSNLENVLTPFYTTKSHGSGIGLSLCAEITRNHSGQLKVENLSPHGAKVCLSWPVK